MGQVSVLNLKIDSVLQKLVDLTLTESVIRKQIAYQFNTGTLADEADQIFVAKNIVASGQTDKFQLVDSNPNPFLEVLNLANLKYIYVKCTQGKIKVGKSPTNPITTPWTTGSGDGNILNEGGVLLLVAPDFTGFNITSTSADELAVTEQTSSAQATYEIVLIGVKN